MTREGANREAEIMAFVNRRERFHFGWNAALQVRGGFGKQL